MIGTRQVTATSPRSALVSTIWAGWLDLYGICPYDGCMSGLVEHQKSARLDLRLPQDVRALIAEAAALAGTSLTDYILNTVVPAARRDVTESRTIRLTQEAWTEFLDILDRPDNEQLAQLRQHSPEWDVERG